MQEFEKREVEEEGSNENNLKEEEKDLIHKQRSLNIVN